MVFNKTALKFIALFAFIVFLAFFALYLLSFYDGRKQETKRYIAESAPKEKAR